MGKLTLSQQDLDALKLAFGPETPVITICEREIEIDRDPVKLLLTDVTTRGAVEHNGVRFHVAATYVDGRLQVEFD